MNENGGAQGDPDDPFHIIHVPLSTIMFPSPTTTLFPYRPSSFLSALDSFRPSSSLFASLESMLDGAAIDPFIMQDVANESMTTYYHELGRKNENVELASCTTVVYTPTTCRNHKCFVCMEEFHEPEELTCLSCRHVYHTTCIGDAVKYNARCPMCKIKLDTRTRTMT